jgi:hypothetical protein
LRFSSTLLVVIAIVVSAMAATGCGDASNAPAAVQFDACLPLLLAADANASADQLAGITAALELWNTAADTQLGLPATGPTAGAASTASPPLLPIHFQSAAAAFHGLYDDQDVQIFVNLDLTEHARVIAIAHEIGHAFGLVHVAPAERLSLMNSGNISVDPTADDVSELAARWGRCAPPASDQPGQTNP